MINIIVEHSKDWWKGGIELDIKIQGFAEKAGLEHIDNCHPRDTDTEFKTEDKKKLSDFKKRLKRSKDSEFITKIKTVSDEL